jgi:hypothetical protein
MISSSGNQHSMQTKPEAPASPKLEAPVLQTWILRKTSIEAEASSINSGSSGIDVGASNFSEAGTFSSAEGTFTTDCPKCLF